MADLSLRPAGTKRQRIRSSGLQPNGSRSSFNGVNRPTCPSRAGAKDGGAKVSTRGAQNQGVRTCHELFAVQRHYYIVGAAAGDIEHRRPREFVRMCANVTGIVAFDHFDRRVVLNGDNSYRDVAQKLSDDVGVP